MGTAPIGRMGFMDDAYMGPKCLNCGHYQWDHTAKGRSYDFSSLGECRGTNANFPSLPQIPCHAKCHGFRAPKEQPNGN